MNETGWTDPEQPEWVNIMNEDARRTLEEMTHRAIFREAPRQERVAKGRVIEPPRLEWSGDDKEL